MKKIIGLLLAMTLLLGLIGCSANTAEKEAVTSPAETTEIKIEHEKGTAVLPSPAKRVVVLEWIYGENLLALGVQPVGMTDIPGFNKWVEIDAELASEVVNLGTRGAANLEEIAALKPDLIITASYYEYDYNLLNAIAPTVVLNPYPTEGGIGEYGHMIDAIEKTALAVGLKDKGQEVIKSIEDKLAEAKGKLQAAGVDPDFAKLIDFSTKDAVSMYLFTDTSLSSVLLEKMGLHNLYRPKKFEIYGQTAVNVENLLEYDDHNLILIADKEKDVFHSGLIAQNVLDGLGFYKNDKMFYLGGNASPFGPLSTLNFIDLVLESFKVNE